MTLAKAPDKSRTTPARRARGFLAASACARGTVGEAAAGRGFAVPEVLTRWPEIVGEHLAGLCQPVKVSYARERGLGATLVIRVEGARAPEVAHLEPRILERVNRFYGYRAIARVKLTQAAPAVPGLAEPAAPFAPAADSAGPDQARAAADLTRGIAHEGLRAALARMAAHVLARRPAPARRDPE